MALVFKTRAVVTSAAMTIKGVSAFYDAVFAARERLRKVSGLQRAREDIWMLPKTGDDQKLLVIWAA
jgi:hypothetical protein